MKLWVKYVIGVLLGAALALVVPADSPTLAFVAEIVVRFGRYIVVPLLFFAAVAAVNRLRETKLILKTGLWTLAVIVASSLILTIAGLASILIIDVPRIPITAERAVEASAVSVAELLRALFPYSAFETLANGSFLLPAFLFGCFAGGACAGDGQAFRPVVALADSLSKLCYNIAALFTELLSIGMIALMCGWTIQSREVIASGTFTPLILLLAALFAVVAFGIYPLVIRFLCHDTRPYRVLYASLAPLVAAFLSGDANFVLPISTRVCKESLGVKRRVNAVANPLLSIFARGGSALVVTISFVVIWRSYVQAIPMANALWIFGVSFGLSFLLGGIPSGGAFVALGVLCAMYGRGFEAGHLLLRPVAPILCSFAAAFDAMSGMFGAYIVAVKTRTVEHHSARNFI